MEVFKQIRIMKGLEIMVGRTQCREQRVDQLYRWFGLLEDDDIVRY